LEGLRKEEFVRTALTWLVLTNLGLQQFVCCAESCDASPALVESHLESTCGHAGHDHDPVAPLSDGDPSSHHLCVATHLFYLRTDATLGIGLDASPAMLSSFDAVSAPLLDATRGGDVVSRCVPPLPALRLRAVLSVWMI
jgi:hypothetical protein